MNLYDLLAAGFPTDLAKPAFLLSDGSQVSYGRLEAEVARVAGHMVAQGVEPGDRVALQAEKSVAGVVIYLATLMAGAVFLPLNAAYTPAEVDYFVKDAAPRLFITDAVLFVAEAAGATPLIDTYPSEDGDLAAIIYTSGTTGRSKGAMLSHGNLAANAQALHQAWGFNPDDVLLHALPIFHVHGLFVALHCAFLSGAPMVWLPRFDDAQV
ncbi:AMP-binding protein, partial [Phenylobacterium sp.]|uniref:AMP-binding protein n=1 Tax=Phenylobacterium sp. TaxID=1871053 RepID=UPI00121050CD